MGKGSINTILLLISLYLCSSLAQAHENNVNHYVMNDELIPSSLHDEKTSTILDHGKNTNFVFDPPWYLFDPCQAPWFARPPFCNQPIEARPPPPPPKQKPTCRSVSHLLKSCGRSHKDFFFFTINRGNNQCCKDYRKISGPCIHQMDTEAQNLFYIIKNICDQYDPPKKFKQPSPPSQTPPSQSPPPTPPPTQTPSSPPPKSPQPPKPSPKAPSPPSQTPPPQSPQPPKAPSPPSQTPSSPQPPKPSPKAPSPPSKTPPSPPPQSPQPPKPSPKTPSPPSKTPPSPPPQSPQPPKPSPPTSSPPPSKPSTPTPPSTPPTPSTPSHRTRPPICSISTVLYDSCDPQFPVADNNASPQERDFMPRTESSSFIFDGAGCCVGHAIFTNDCKSNIKDLSFAKQKIFRALQHTCGF